MQTSVFTSVSFSFLAKFKYKCGSPRGSMSLPLCLRTNIFTSCWEKHLVAFYRGLSYFFFQLLTELCPAGDFSTHAVSLTLSSVFNAARMMPSRHDWIVREVCNFYCSELVGSRLVHLSQSSFYDFVNKPGCGLNFSFFCISSLPTLTFSPVHCVLLLVISFELIFMLCFRWCTEKVSYKQSKTK